MTAPVLRMVWRRADWCDQIPAKPRRPAHAVRTVGNVTFVEPRCPGFRLRRGVDGWQAGHWIPTAPRSRRFRAWHDPVATREQAAGAILYNAQSMPGFPVWPDLVECAA